MRVLYLHQYFITRRGYTGTRSYEFARRLVGRGHDVTMMTSGRHAAPEITCPPDRDYVEADVEGIGVLGINAAYNNSMEGTRLSGMQRMRQFHHFARLAVRIATGREKPDIVFASHTPLTIGLAGMRIADHFKIPFVFEVRDVWPDALVNCGALRNPLVVWYLRRMAKKIYAAADHIVALSPGMKDGVVAADVDPDKVTVITNGSDMDLFRPDLDGSCERERLGLGDRFCAIYFGAMGRANGLGYAVDAAAVLKQRGRADIVIVLHGGGAERELLMRKVADLQLDNVVFSDPVPDKAQVARIVAACDACLTIYASTRREQSWSPNKLFDALSAGKPVLCNVPGWLADLIESNDCGRHVDPDHPDRLAESLIQLADDRELCARMGRAGRALAQREFSREVLTDRLERVLTHAVDRG